MTPMEELWEQVSQPADDGQKYITYKTAQDLLFLYANGFVDHRKYTLDAWIKAFDECRQSDGSYKITKQQWLAKESYRYSGPVEEPFDPHRLQERDFTEAEFEAVLKYFVCPSTWINESSIPIILDDLRKRKKLVNGKIRIDPAVKKEIQEVLDKFPSPLRVLQLDVARIRKRGRFKEPVRQKNMTAYVAGIDAQKLASARLNQLAKTKAPVPEETAPQTGGIPLKDLMKKKPRGPGRA
ncbi:MAG: hypothetical protein HY539_04000 [Deltaproteobacteria bacterium]|nr:hypothetical protein [Deltaproteobacteria bacterium]